MTLSLGGGLYHDVVTWWWSVSRRCHLVVVCIMTLSLGGGLYHDVITCWWSVS